MTARTLLTISAYLFLQMGSFFWSFRIFGRKLILAIFHAYFLTRKYVGGIGQKRVKNASEQYLYGHGYGI